MTTTPTVAELLPCPFCGASTGKNLGWLKKLGANCFVWCAKCGASGPSTGHTEAEAIAAWNTRTPTDHGELVEPDMPGSFVGDIWFGDPVKRTLGTHRWDGAKWEVLPDEMEGVLNLLAAARSRIAELEAATALSPRPDAWREGDIGPIWQQAAYNHDTYSAQPTPEDDLRFFALGICGEAGELANFVKKRIRDGDGHDEDLRFECADVLAYTIMMARSLGMGPKELIETVAHKQAVFVAKMEARNLNLTEGA